MLSIYLKEEEEEEQDVKDAGDDDDGDGEADWMNTDIEPPEEMDILALEEKTYVYVAYRCISSHFKSIDDAKKVSKK